MDLEFNSAIMPVEPARQMWADVFCRTVMVADPEFIDADRFGVRFRFRRPGRIGMLRADMRSIRHRRGDRHVAQDGERKVSVLFADRGAMRCESPRNIVRVERRSGCLSAHDSPHVAEWGADTRMFSIELPEDLLSEAGAPRDRDYLDFAVDDPVAMLLRRYAAMLWDGPAEAWAANADSCDVHMAELTVDLMKRGAARSQGLASDGRKALAVRDLIEQRHADPEFDLPQAAGILGLSPEAVRQAMTLTGETFPQALNRRRLEAARAALERPGRRIAEIALDCGFSDISYFNRLFRERYGAPPRRLRKAGMLG